MARAGAAVINVNCCHSKSQDILKNPTDVLRKRRGVFICPINLPNSSPSYGQRYLSSATVAAVALVVKPRAR